MERKVLGRGLASLIPEKIKKDTESRIEYLKVDKIKPNKYQPREEFDQKKLEELISSIKEKGIVQPILVRPKGDSYELVAGERRLRAVKSLGIEDIPAFIKDVDDANVLELSLIENIQREELNPIEEAHAYQRLIDEFNLTQDRIGQAVGKDNTTISNSIRLLSLPKKIQDYLTSGALTVGHAKVLLSIDNTGTQLELSKKTVDNDLSVRSLENYLKRKRRLVRSATVDYNLRAIEEELQRILGTKVRIVRRKKTGKIEIEYYSEQDLERILRILRAVI